MKNNEEAPRTVPKEIDLALLIPNIDIITKERYIIGINEWIPR